MTTETLQRLTAAYDLYQRWIDLQVNRFRLCARDAATELGFSQAKLVVSGCGKTALQLGGDFRKLIEELPSLGSVIAVTRSDHVIIEKTGSVEQVEIYCAQRMGSVVGKGIDLRLFFDHWQ